MKPRTTFGFEGENLLKNETKTESGAGLKVQLYRLGMSLRSISLLAG
jgi:hypothetical protein